jgi:hypothetical protein
MDPSLGSMRNKLQELVAKRAARLLAFQAEQVAVQELNTAIMGIEMLIKMEERDAAAAKAPQAELPNMETATQAPPVRKGIQLMKLSDVIRQTLQDGQPHRVEDLITVAQKRGFDFGAKEPQKVVGFTLMGMSNGKKIKRIGEGVWQAVSH